MKTAISGRAFIAMMRPLLGIEQKSITSLSITAKHNDVVWMEIECVGMEAEDVSIVEITTREEKPEVRRFMVEVTEMTSIIDTRTKTN